MNEHIPEPTVPGVMYRDTRRGHLRMDLDDPPGWLVGSDLGGVLQLSTADAWLSIEQAREVGEALLWWADRAESRRPVAAAVEDVDLLALIEEDA
jgi:hypothetical protein